MGQLGLNLYQRNLYSTKLIQDVTQIAPPRLVINAISSINVTKNMIELCSKAVVAECVVAICNNERIIGLEKVLKSMEINPLSISQIELLDKPFMLSMIMNKKISFIDALETISKYDITPTQVNRVNIFSDDILEGKLSLDEAIVKSAKVEEPGFIMKLISYLLSFIWNNEYKASSNKTAISNDLEASKLPDKKFHGNDLNPELHPNGIEASENE